jgi:hypothetical protein
VSVSQAMPCPEAILPAPTTTPTSVPATPDLSWSVV